jgi:hypothetical protein
MWLEDHFGNGSMLQRNERVRLAASFWNNIGAGMVIGGMAAAFFLDKPRGTWAKIGIAKGLVRPKSAARGGRCNRCPSRSRRLLYMS